jgi:large subunit ribosomal protein L9
LPSRPPRTPPTARTRTPRFGSVTSQDIVDAIKQARGLKLDRRKVHLEQPLRTTGTHMVTIEVHEGVTADVKTIITSE